MKYYGYLLLVFFTLVSSVLIENRNLFNSGFFTVAYISMSMVLLIGAKTRETAKIDTLLGMLLLFSVAFLSTETLLNIFLGNISEITIFKFEVIISLDYCALAFLRSAKTMSKIQQVMRKK